MITERDLNEAIAECQGVVRPTSNVCLKLASYLTIKDHMFGDGHKEDGYSMETRDTDFINYYGHSEFAERINGRNFQEVLPIIDELMETLQIVNPRLYNSVMDKL